MDVFRTGGYTARENPNIRNLRMPKPQLTLPLLKAEAKKFVKVLSGTPIVTLYGATDGKAVGTYVEQAFNRSLVESYDYATGNAASGIDFPALEVDVKATSIKQPQSSCPFKSAEQKVYGLGYNLLVFVYEKNDDPKAKAAVLDFKHLVFVAKERTADYQTTYGLLGILERKGNKDDIVAFLEERHLPLEEIGRERLAERILKERPHLGYLTISNALQWRLQYTRVITIATDGKTNGVENVLT
jgi:hypothetical protein